jgi:hypothetical protein
MTLADREHPEINELVNRLRVYQLNLEKSNKDRVEAADCITGLVDFVSLLISRIETLEAEECPCQKRETELNGLFSEWNEEN